MLNSARILEGGLRDGSVMEESFYSLETVGREIEGDRLRWSGRGVEMAENRDERCLDRGAIGG